MEAAHDALSIYPNGIDPPIEIASPDRPFVICDSAASILTFGTRCDRGRAVVYLDLLPAPEFRFEFTYGDNDSIHVDLGDAILDLGPPVGRVNISISQAGSTCSGLVQDPLVPDGQLIGTADFVIMNGPRIHGALIRRDSQVFGGRLVGATENGISVTVDALRSDKQERRAIYEATHVARCEFSPPRTWKEVLAVRFDLFRCLSLMKCRWVGVVGPWIRVSSGGQVEIVCPSTTKTMRNGGSTTWCKDLIGDSFASLFPVVHRAFSNGDRAEGLQTALHWLIESEQCAGGVEGALILQQAALECLAWIEVVQNQRLCSEAGFKSLPASDRIRWLLSLSRISSEIPSKATLIASYAREFNLRDLVDVLADVRNALVHAEPKKVARLFVRNFGAGERSELWYYIGGILQLALLSSLGYQGRLMRRDTEAQFASDAIRTVPWADAKAETPSDQSESRQDT